MVEAEAEAEEDDTDASGTSSVDAMATSPVSTHVRVDAILASLEQHE